MGSQAQNQLQEAWVQEKLVAGSLPVINVLFREVKNSVHGEGRVPLHEVDEQLFAKVAFGQ